MTPSQSAAENTAYGDAHAQQSNAILVFACVCLIKQRFFNRGCKQINQN